MKRPGFTVLEIVVSLFLIGSVLTHALISASDIVRKAGDNQQLKNIENIRAALNLYKQEQGFYPAAITTNAAIVSPNGKVYLESVPEAVTGKLCVATNYAYSNYQQGLDYRLDYCINSNIKNITQGLCVASADTLCCQGDDCHK